MARIDNVDITQDDLIAQFGDYYLDNGQNMENLHMLPFEPFGTAEAGNMRETDQTVLREANVRVEGVLQPYQHEFTPKGGMSILPVEIWLHHVKVDVKILPNQLKDKWAQFLVTNELDPTTYPLIAFIIEKYLIPQAMEDLELKAIYKGIRLNPEELTPGESVDCMDGLGKHLTVLEAANKIDWINTGSIATSPTDFVTQIEDFIRAIPEKYRYNMSMVINMNRTLRDKFKQGMRDKYKVYYDDPKAQELNVYMFENFSIAGRASMVGKSKIWTSPKDNLIFPVKGFSNKSAFDIQKIDRYVKFLSDWYIGAGFIQPEEIFANELT